MKRQLLFLLNFCCAFISYAQLSDYVTEVISPVGLAQNGTTLYIAEVGQSKISQVDMTATNPTAVDFLVGISFPTKLIVIDDYLYFTSFQYNGVARVDLTIANPPIEVVVGGLNQPFGIAVKDNLMYLSLRSDGTVIRFDYTQTNPTTETVITGLGAFLNDITFDGNDLYMARGESGMISKIDTSQSTPVLEDVLAVPGVLDVVVNNGYLYYSNSFLSRFDLSDSTPTPESILSPLFPSAWEIHLDGTDIFLAQQTGGKISRLNTTFVDPTLSPDYNTLLDIYNNTDGPNWTNSSNWFDPSVSLYSWHGVSTDENNRVIGLNLAGNNLTGNIPSEVGNLDELKSLRVNSNTLAGALPSSLYSLTNLETLWLSDNGFTGSLSPSIGNLSNLTSLAMFTNQFSGNIPTELGNLTNLTNLDLRDNNFDGVLPASLSNLINLTSTNIAENNFEGIIPFNAPNANIFATNNFYDFSDLEPFILASNYNFFDYSPQRTPDEAESIAIGTTQNLTLTVDDTNINREMQNPAMNNEYQWFKDDVAIAGANANSYQILNTQESDSGIYHCEITNTIVADLTIVRADITLTVDASLSTTEVKANGFKIYPNPTSNWLTIDLGNQSNASIVIHDINGKLVLAKDIETNIHATNVSQLQSGLYIISLTSDNETVTKRFIKQ